MPAPTYLKTLKTIHLTLLSMIAVFSGVVFYLVYSGKYPPTIVAPADRVFQVIALVLSGGMLIIGFRLFNSKVLQLRKSTLNVKQKLEQYRAASITWWAMIEGPCLFALVGFLLTNNYAFFALACFHLAILFMFQPKNDSIVMLLNLNSEESRELGE